MLASSFNPPSMLASVPSPLPTFPPPIVRSPTMSSSDKLESNSQVDSSQIQDDEPVIRDGGARAWCTLLGGWLTIIATFGYTFAFGVYQDVYTREHAVSASRVSWIGSTQLFLLIGVGLPAGKLLDMGYFRPVVFVGSLIFSFSLFMLSLAHPDKYYQVFLSQGVGMGIGSGLLYVPAMAVQAHHWRKWRSLAMGFVITGSAVGGIIFPIMLNQLFPSSTGFAWGVRASVFIVLGLLIAENVLMSPRQDVASRKKEPPAMKSLFTDLPYMVVNFGAFCLIWGVYYPYFYLQLFSILHGLDPNFCFYTVRAVPFRLLRPPSPISPTLGQLAIMNASSIPGRVFAMYFADKFGVLNMAVPSALACSVMTLALLGVSSTGGVLAFAILYGFFSGAFFALLSPTAIVFARSESEVRCVHLFICVHRVQDSHGAFVRADVAERAHGPPYRRSAAQAKLPMVEACHLQCGRDVRRDRHVCYLLPAARVPAEDEPHLVGK
ncbi:major facilitator superfamily domain-containing protein [Amylostereum chailletii]|nr:major facilitator superfamily domain-containing protein [Amylostereum chailletii]